MNEPNLPPPRSPLPAQQLDYRPPAADAGKKPRAPFGIQMLLGCIAFGMSIGVASMLMLGLYSVSGSIDDWPVWAGIILSGSALVGLSATARVRWKWKGFIPGVILGICLLGLLIGLCFAMVAFWVK